MLPGEVLGVTTVLLSPVVQLVSTISPVTESPGSCFTTTVPRSVFGSEHVAAQLDSAAVVLPSSHALVLTIDGVAACAEGAASAARRKTARIAGRRIGGRQHSGAAL